jgi:hypothetical protein
MSLRLSRLGISYFFTRLLAKSALFSCSACSRAFEGDRFDVNRASGANKIHRDRGFPARGKRAHSPNCKKLDPFAIVAVVLHHERRWKLRMAISSALQSWSQNFAKPRTFPLSKRPYNGCQRFLIHILRSGYFSSLDEISRCFTPHFPVARVQFCAPHASYK